MKKIIDNVVKTFVFIIIFYAFVMFVGSIINSAVSKNDVPPADGFEIQEYNVILDVGIDNKILVTENITVNFTSSYKHGIYKYTPLWLEYTNQNGKTIKRKSVLSNYRAINDNYEVDTVNKKERIKIGNAYEYVDLGEKNYVIKYTYDMGKDPYNGFDEFIFHAYGDYWGTEIKNASIQVNMPKSFDLANVNFFTDKYRKENVNEYVDYYISGNTLYAKFNQDKYYNNTLQELDKSLTVDISLPEDYFVGGSFNYGWLSFIICLITFILTILNFRRWYKYGKDFPKRTETIEFYPPNDYNSAEIGYIYGKQTSKKLTISIIVQLASKGYIKIDEVEKDGKNEIQITNLVITPEEKLKYNDLVPDRVIRVRKLKLADASILNKDELTMMTYLFKIGDEKTLKTNIDKFLKVRDSLVQKGFIQILEDNEDTRFDELNKRKEEYEISKKQYEKDKKEYDNKISNMKSLSKIEEMVYKQLFYYNNIIILSEHSTFYQVFSKVNNELDKELKNLIDDKVASKKQFHSIVICMINLVLFIISYFSVEDMAPNLNIIYLLSFICFFINIYFTIIMRRKTEYGEDIIAKIKGFRNFLITVSKEELENLVSKDPSYFYNILPYTYVLNVSKKWISKFENIKMSELDMGSYDLFDGGVDDIYRDVQFPSSTSSGRSSGDSSCGGGCSSCGGGCSSCGGGGSW